MSTANIKKVFVTGAGGFIGSTIAGVLADAGYEVRGLIRREEQSGPLIKLNVTPVIGSLDDAEVLSREAQAADAVINAADSDHRPALVALLETLRGSGKTLLHTSGSSIVGDAAAGERGEAKIFTEDTLGEPLPHKRARRAIDSLVLEAHKTHGPLRTAVLCPCLIYGQGRIEDSASVQLPRIVAQARKSGIAKHIGSGENRWSNVHVEDVAAAYKIVLEKASADANNFYFIETNESSFAELTEAVAAALKLPPPQSFTLDEAKAEWGSGMAEFVLASNSRIRGSRLRDLGWQPKHPEGVIEYIRKELH